MKEPLVWMDLEMTGLEPEQDQILEVALLVTDEKLVPQTEGKEWILHAPAKKFSQMDEWNQNQHTKSGLWEKVLASSIPVQEVEAHILATLQAHMKPKQGILAGNSIWQDRRFIRCYMPTLDTFLHYRMLDVSSFKVMVTHWFPNGKYPKPESSHRALDDILGSMKELAYYQTLFLGSHHNQGIENLKKIGER